MVAGAPIDDGLARHLFKGKRLQDVELPCTDGRLISPGRLAGRAVFVVYPWTGRPGMPDPASWDWIAGAHGSTPAAVGFSNAHGKFAGLGIGVFGLSTQSTDYQRELVDRLKLGFPILSDEGFVFSDALGLPRFAADGVNYLKRLTILARNGAIEQVFYPVRDPSRQAQEALASL